MGDFVLAKRQHRQQTVPDLATEVIKSSLEDKRKLRTTQRWQESTETLSKTEQTIKQRVWDYYVRQANELGAATLEQVQSSSKTFGEVTAFGAVAHGNVHQELAEADEELDQILMSRSRGQLEEEKREPASSEDLLKYNSSRREAEAEVSEEGPGEEAISESHDLIYIGDTPPKRSSQMKTQLAEYQNSLRQKLDYENVTTPSMSRIIHGGPSPTIIFSSDNEVQGDSAQKSAQSMGFLASANKGNVKKLFMGSSYVSTGQQEGILEENKESEHGASRPESCSRSSSSDDSQTSLPPSEFTRPREMDQNLNELTEQIIIRRDEAEEASSSGSMDICDENTNTADCVPTAMNQNASEATVYAADNQRRTANFSNHESEPAPGF